MYIYIVYVLVLQSFFSFFFPSTQYNFDASTNAMNILILHLILSSSTVNSQSSSSREMYLFVLYILVVYVLCFNVFSPFFFHEMKKLTASTNKVYIISLHSIHQIHSFFNFVKDSIF